MYLVKPKTHPTQYVLLQSRTVCLSQNALRGVLTRIFVSVNVLGGVVLTLIGRTGVALASQEEGD